MSSIFLVVPDTQRIFLSTRITNAKAITAYTSWAFVQDTYPMQDPGQIFNPEYWKFIEYCADQKNMLQKIAQIKE